MGRKPMKRRWVEERGSNETWMEERGELGRVVVNLIVAQKVVMAAFLCPCLIYPAVAH